MLVMAQTDPSTVAAALESAGPYAIAAVLLLGVVALWRKLGARDARLEELSEKILGAFQAQTEAVTQFHIALERQNAILDRVEASTRDCPAKKELSR